MQTKNQISLTRKTLYGIMLVGVFFSAFGAGNLPSARAQEESTEPPTPDAAVAVVDYLFSESDKLPLEVKDAIALALTKWAYEPPINGRFSLLSFRWEETWALATLTSADLISPSISGQESSIFNGKLASLVIVYDDDRWVAAVEGDNNISVLLNLIPENELSAKAKNALFATDDGVNAQQTYNNYKFPWPSDRPWHNHGGWHGTSNLAIDLDVVDNTNSDVLSAAPGTITSLATCSPSDHYIIRITTENTSERISYIHLNGASVRAEGLVQGNYVAQGRKLGIMAGAFSGSDTCGISSTGAHLHLELPMKPFTIDGKTYTDSYWYDGVNLYSTNGGGGGTNNPPAGYAFCSNEGGRCNFSGTADVVYGALNSFTSPRSFTNGVDCNNGVFGDPISGVGKACYYKPTGGGTPPADHPVQFYLAWHYEQGYCYVDNVGWGNLDGCPGYDQNISSVILQSGWSVRVYKERDLGGTSRCFTSNDDDFSNNTFDDGSALNDQTSSFELYNQSSCPSLTPNPPAPSSPSNGQYFNEGEAINLSWSATGSEYYGEVWGGPSGTLTFGWQSGTSKNIGSQWAGYTYNWKIKAKNSSGESGWSETRTFTVLPGAPSSLSATAASCSQINLGWSDNSGNEEGYKVYRNGSLIATLGSGVTSYQNTGLAGNTNYSYVVKAYRGSIESNSSNTANATTQTCGGGSNDDINSPKITSIPYTDTMDTLAATQSAGDPALVACNRAAGLASVWYRLTPSSSILIDVDTNGSNYDTMLGVFSGSPGSLSEIKCDDDSGEGLRSNLRVILSGGTTYYIVASEYVGLLGLSAASDAKSSPDLTSQAGGSLKLHIYPVDISPRMPFGGGPNNIAIYSSGNWKAYDFASKANVANVTTGMPSAGCIPAPMDYDGDGVDEFTQLCNGTWHFYNDNGTLNKSIWTGGVAGDLPVPADYNGDGIDEVVVFRNNAWMFYDFTTKAYIGGVWTGVPAGLKIPSPMDYDGDGAADFTVFSGGPWHFFNDDGTYNKGIWTGGLSTDVPAAGDYNGNATDEVVVFRGGAWFFYDFVTRAYIGSTWTGGGTSSKPAPVDFDLDGDLDFATYLNGAWSFYNSNGSLNKAIWTGGVVGDKPISRRYLP